MFRSPLISPQNRSVSHIDDLCVPYKCVCMHSLPSIFEAPPIARDPQNVEFAGIRIHLQTAESLLAVVAAAIRDSKRILIGHHNLHGLSTYAKVENIHYRRFFEIADLALADGMSMVMLGRLLRKRISRKNRIAFNDWLPTFLEHAADRQWRVFYLGSAPKVMSRGIQVLSLRYPGLQIAGHHGHFNASDSSKENRNVLDEINNYQPDVLFVGMGMPRQEKWLFENHRNLSAPVILTSGATLDYIAGEKRMAPRWMGAIGLEWAFRLVTEPTRLAHRYLVEPWGLLGLLFRPHVK